MALKLTYYGQNDSVSADMPQDVELPDAKEWFVPWWLRLGLCPDSMDTSGYWSKDSGNPYIAQLGQITAEMHRLLWMD